MERSAEDAALDRRLLASLWRDLSHHERVLLGSVFSGLSLAEIAVRAGTSTEAAAQRISRARRRMRKLVAAPLAVLAPLTSGQAMARALHRLVTAAARHAAGMLDALRPAEPAIMSMLAGIAAGVLALPGMSTAPPRAVAGGPGDGASSPAPVADAGRDDEHRPSEGSGDRNLAFAVRRPDVPSPTPPPSSTAPPLPPPGNIELTSFTPSPNYAQDHTIFASARCPHLTCGLYRTDDGGHTWQWRPALGIVDGDGYVAYLLPPSYPKDPTIFAYGPSRLYRSDDGGTSFLPVAQLDTAKPTAAIDPTSAPGDTHVFILSGSTTDAYATLMVYSARLRAVVPATAFLPAAAVGAKRVFTAPGARAVYVDTVDKVSGQHALYACAGLDPCRSLGPSALQDGSIIVPSPTFASDFTFFEWSWWGVDAVTLDGHRTKLDLGPYTPRDVGAVLPALDYATSHRVDIFAGVAFEEDFMLRLIAGRLATLPLKTPDSMDWSTLTQLPDGTLIAGSFVSPYGPAGLVCSHDHGVTWAPTC